MKTYKELLATTHDNIVGREDIEWSNCWYDRSNTENSKRILLIGDSTARIIRSTFSKMVNRPVDLFAHSGGLHDIIFVKQLEAFFSSDHYKYSTIFVQLGHHSQWNEDGIEYSDCDYIRYRDDLCSLVLYLRQYCSNIVLLSIFLDVEPPKSKMVPSFITSIIRSICGENYNLKVNEIKRKKNNIIYEVSQRFNLPYCDINRYMEQINSCKILKFVHYDHIHFERKSYNTIVKHYMEYLND